MTWTSRLILHEIDVPVEVRDVIKQPRACGVLLEVTTHDRVLYVGLAGGKLVSGSGDKRIRIARDDDRASFTAVGFLVFESLKQLDVDCPAFVFSEMSSKTARLGLVKQRLEEILLDALPYSKILIVGDYAGELDGKVTPLLNVEGAIMPSEVKRRNEHNSGSSG